MGLNGPLFWYAAPIFLTLALGEVALLRIFGLEVYTLRDGLASLAVGLGRRLVSGLTVIVTGALAVFLWRHRLWTAPLDTIWGIPLLFLGTEFFYYWHHRLSHEVRLLWASHAVHHSAGDINLLAAYRLPWTGLIIGPFILVFPLVVLGFRPAAVVTALTFNLLYQTWLHTQLIGKLGPLEWLMNTPSHHRVHHAVNPHYLDRNYGGVTVLFDRLFGSLAIERADDRCRYGLVKPIITRNPFAIAFHEWIRLAQDLRRAADWRQRIGYLFGPPGWTPVGRIADSENGRRPGRLLSEAL